MSASDAALTESLLSVAGRVALVTGAGQGVGREAALYLAAHGCATVLVNDFFQDRADAVVEEINALGSRGIALVGDVTDYDSVTRLVQHGVEQAGGLHIVVNNAGNAGPAPDADALTPFWETDPAQWQAWLGTNLYGVLNVCRAAVPLLLRGEQGGSIINVISDAGRVGEPHLALYSAAKAGAAGFSRALAKALGAQRIRVNCVSLGGIQTPGVRQRFDDPEAMKKLLRPYILRRIGQPGDAAAMILFLASDAASWITGQTYPVNGGYSLAQ